jgi:hypothetical protein
VSTYKINAPTETAGLGATNSAWALERLERDFTRATGRPMHHNTRELLRHNFREAELRARVIELGLIAVIVMFLGLLLRRRR